LFVLLYVRLALGIPVVLKLVPVRPPLLDALGHVLLMVAKIPKEILSVAPLFLALRRLSYVLLAGCRSVCLPIGVSVSGRGLAIIKMLEPLEPTLVISVQMPQKPQMVTVPINQIIPVSDPCLVMELSPPTIGIPFAPREPMMMMTLLSNCRRIAHLEAVVSPCMMRPPKFRVVLTLLALLCASELVVFVFLPLHVYPLLQFRPALPILVELSVMIPLG
jgi:hypothetical protein